MRLTRITTIIFGILLQVIRSQQIITSLCSSLDNTNNQTQPPASQICECVNESSSPWGLRVIRIDCTDYGMTYEQFQVDYLPLGTEQLDLSWNRFDQVPELFGKGLKRLKMCHNRIIKIADRNFANIPNLRELDLSWNSINLISMKAFDELKSLQRLDLSHNNLHRLSLNIFSPLSSLDVLNLSWNKRLNESSDIEELDMFLAFSITPKLKTLKLGHCNLKKVTVTHGAGLQELYLDWNQLDTVSELPGRLKSLDLSGNPFEKLEPKQLPHLFQLESLILEDMPELTAVEEYSLFGLPAMKHLSLQNSQKLVEFSPYAFGMNVIINETDIALESLNLRGTAIKSLNSSLHLAFDSLKSLNLAGAPLQCNCDLYWLQSLNIETNGRCSEPIRLRGWRLSKLSEDQFGCDTAPKWISEILNGLLIILLICLCLAGIWLIILGLRPPKKQSPSKVGVTSPYARVTIEPNRAE